MRILIVDEYIAIGKVLKDYIAKYHPSFNITFIYKLNLVNYYLENENYDVIVLNFGSFNNNRLLDNILKYNKKQKIVIISTDAKCTDQISCEHCKESYNKIRLISPFSLYNLMDYILNKEGQECPHYKHCDDFKFVI